jgi:GTP pyrophosphokinase
LAAIGQGDINTQQIAAKVLEAEHAQEEAEGTAFIPPMPRISTGEMTVLGTGGLLTNIARCCQPVPGDSIIGYVTRGRGVTIHKQDCPNILRTRERERLIDVTWGTTEQTYPVMIKLTAYDRSGLLRDIGTVIANHKITMSSISSSTQKNVATIYATLQVSSLTQLSRILTKLEQVRNVLQVRRQTD